MKKLIKYLVLSMTLIFIFSSVTAYAQMKNEESTGKKAELHEIYVNPAYKDIITEEMLEEHSRELRSQNVYYSTQADGTEYCKTVNEAVTYMRKQLVARNEVIEFLLPVAQYYDGFMRGVYNAAVAYSDSCSGQEGDALKYSIGGWSASGSVAYSDDGVTCYLLEYDLTMYTTAADEKLLTKDVNAAMKELNLSGKTEQEKITAIHDYICNHVEYDYDNLGNSSYKYQFTAFAALHHGTAVCQGYAVLFYRMCKEAGLSVRVVTSDDHAWNIVKKGKVYYNVDATWDDQSSWISTDYFMKGDREILGDYHHAREQEHCTDEYYDAFPMKTDPALNLSNSSDSLTTVTGKTVSTTANGKGKVLVFGRFNSETWAYAFVNSLKASDIADFDFYVIDTSGLGKDELKDVRDNMGLSGSVWCYDESSDVSSIGFNYLHACGYSGGVYNPIIVFIDSKNKVQHFTVGYMEPKRFRKYAETYLDLDTTPKIITQPSNLKVEMGKTAKFTVEAEGSGLSYQWYYRNSSSDSWIKSTSSSGQSATYSFTAKETFNGRQCRCKVTNSSGSVYTSTVTLTVTPKITSQPTNLTVEMGKNARFTVEAEGTELSYQWYYRNSSSDSWIKSTSSSGQSATYVFAAKETFNGRQCRCKVTSKYGEVYTKTVTLTVTPKIKSQPKDLTVEMGKTAKFTVTAEGTELSYQWYYRSSASDSWMKSTSSSGQSAAYSFTAKETFNGRQCRCKVTSQYGSVYTEIVTLTVTPKIISQPADLKVEMGKNAKFSVEAEGTELSYQWYYRDSSSGSWKKSTSASGQTATYSFTAKETYNGRQCRCLITSEYGSVYTDIVTLTVTPKIISQPKSVTAEVGKNARFTVEAEGTELTYQWYYRDSSSGSWKKSTSASGQTATYCLTAKETYNGRQCRCLVTSKYGSVYTKTVTLTVILP